jgi:hypothetical protein
MRRRLKMGYDDDDVRGSEVSRCEAEVKSPGLELPGTQLGQVVRKDLEESSTHYLSSKRNLLINIEDFILRS